MICTAECSFGARGIKELKYTIYKERPNNWHQWCHSCRLVPNFDTRGISFGTRAWICGTWICGTCGTKMTDTSIEFGTSGANLQDDMDVLFGTRSDTMHIWG
jgi:hypothetical protein